MEINYIFPEYSEIETQEPNDFYNVLWWEMILDSQGLEVVEQVAVLEWI